MRRSILLALLVATGTSAQLPQMSKDSLEAQDAWRKGAYMQARRLLATSVFNPDGSVKDQFAWQMWQQGTPFITNELPLDALTNNSRGTPDQAWATQVAAATAHPAIAEIVRRARSTNVVILNEAHYSPRDRAFALELARALRPLGYNYLAAEDFSDETVERLAHDHVVRRGTGFYLNDPVFASFVTQALRLGYRPIAYEQSARRGQNGTAVQDRENDQVENLMTEIFRREPHAKVLIHVGHAHVLERPIRRPDGSERLWMAARLKQVLGIDPLTIEQIVLTDLSPSARAAYPLAAAKAGKTDSVLFDGDHPLLLGDNPGTDLQVVHPARAYRCGRPTWLATLGGRPVTIPARLLPHTGERLVQAFAADAPADAVPLDQVLVTAGRPAPRLMLPPGVKVRYAVQD